MQQEMSHLQQDDDDDDDDGDTRVVQEVTYAKFSLAAL